MANDGTVKIGTELDDGGFKKGLSKLGGVAKTALKGGVAVIGSVTAAAGAAVGGLLALESATEEYRIAQGKLNTAFEAAGYSVETAAEAYNGFFGILGDTDTATEASQLLAKLAESEEDVSKWTDIAAGVFGTFGDSLPIEGLIEASNETAKTGTVVGVLADALNWAGISEDKFNEKLAAAGSEAERNQLIMDTLSATYDEASEAFYRNNEALVASREAQAEMDSALAELGQAVSDVKTRMMGEFLPAVSQVTQGLAGMLSGTEGAEEQFTEGIGMLVDSAVEKLPEFLEFGAKILAAILEGIINNLPKMVESIPEILTTIVTALQEIFPSLIEAGGQVLEQLATGISEGIPALLEALPDIILNIINFLTENLPTILQKGSEIIMNLINGISSAIPKIAEKLPEIIQAIVNFITENLPAIIKAGVSIVVSLIYGILSAIPSIILAIPDIINVLLDAFNQLPSLFVEIGKSIIQGLIDGFLSMIGNIGNAIGSVVDAIFGTANEAASGKSINVSGESTGVTASSMQSAASMLRSAMPMAANSVRMANANIAPMSAVSASVASAPGAGTGASDQSGSSTSKVIIGFNTPDPRGFARFLTPYIASEQTLNGPSFVEGAKV